MTEKEISRIIARFLALENGWIVMPFLRWRNLKKKCMIWEDCYIFKKTPDFMGFLSLFMFGSSGSPLLHAGSSPVVVPEPRISFSRCGVWALRGGIGGGGWWVVGEKFKREGECVYI